jgi:hypothetical protein
LELFPQCGIFCYAFCHWCCLLKSDLVFPRKIDILHFKFIGSALHKENIKSDTLDTTIMMRNVPNDMAWPINFMHGYFVNLPICKEIMKQLDAVDY